MDSEQKHVSLGIGNIELRAFVVTMLLIMPSNRKQMIYPRTVQWAVNASKLRTYVHSSVLFQIHNSQSLKKEHQIHLKFNRFKRYITIAMSAYVLHINASIYIHFTSIDFRICPMLFRPAHLPIKWAMPMAANANERTKAKWWKNEKWDG